MDEHNDSGLSAAGLSIVKWAGYEKSKKGKGIEKMGGEGKCMGSVKVKS